MALNVFHWWHLVCYATKDLTNEALTCWTAEVLTRARITMTSHTKKTKHLVSSVLCGASHPLYTSPYTVQSTKKSLYTSTKSTIQIQSFCKLKILCFLGLDDYYSSSVTTTINKSLAKLFYSFNLRSPSEGGLLHGPDRCSHSVRHQEEGCSCSKNCQTWGE